MNENKTSCAPADNQQTLWDMTQLSFKFISIQLKVANVSDRVVNAFAVFTLIIV